MIQALPSETRTRALGLSAVGTTLHAVFGLALLVGYAAYVPAAKRAFDECGVRPPAVTQTVVRLSMWVADNWALLLPAGAAALAADFATTWALARRGRYAVLWVVAVGVTLVALVGVTTCAAEVPLAKMRAGPAR
ncbi:MAG: hypothetical protein ACKODX_23540 [Gemmata sp.]